MINVTGAIIICNNKILIARRGKGKHMEGYWEFPGGKQELGETLEDCLVREIKEKLNKTIEVLSPFEQFSWSDNRGDFILHTFLCSCEDDTISCHPDHQRCKWVEVDELSNYRFAPGDIPSIKRLSKSPK